MGFSIITKNAKLVFWVVILFYQETIQTLGSFNSQIDLSNYSKGVYNLVVKTADSISNHKLILK